MQLNEEKTLKLKAKKARVGARDGVVLWEEVGGVVLDFKEWP